MNPIDRWAASATQVGVLVDTNLLVLLVVGDVNRDRIETFKRTQSYTVGDYEVLTDALRGKLVFTLPHVLSEVSNLTDLSGPEEARARQVLRERIKTFEEPLLPSRDAAASSVFERLGLTDAAILVAARDHRCAVLTADLRLVLALEGAGVPVLNFNRFREWKLGL